LTVSVTVVEWTVLPLVPVIVMVEVDVGTANPVLLLPQPESDAVATQASTTRSTHIAMPFRLRLNSHAPPRHASDTPAGMVPPGRPVRLALSAGTSTVIVVVAGFVVPGTRPAGEKLTLAPLDKPMADKVTICVKGLSAVVEVRLTVYSTLVPR
jgi:hypothetical protein